MRVEEAPVPSVEAVQGQSAAVAPFSSEVQEVAAVSRIAEMVAAGVEATPAVSQEEEATPAAVAPAGIGKETL